MRNYISLLKSLLEQPHHLLGQKLHFDLSQNDFPILSLRPIIVARKNYEVMQEGTVIKDNKLHYISFIPCVEAFIFLPNMISSAAVHAFTDAKKNDCTPGELIILMGEVFLDIDNIEDTKNMLKKWPKKPPKIEIDDNYEFKLIGYNPHT